MSTRISVPPAVAHWQALADHINRWFHSPDLEALKVALCAAIAHRLLDSDPVWLFVVGPSGSGKTSIVVNALAGNENTYIVGDLTSRSFISHFGREQDKGLLHRIGSSGILVCKDFTSIMSKRDDERAEIAAQLREIYDGQWSRSTGHGTTDWKGKVTVIAACTPALERAWALKRELGERFVTVRWPRVGGTAMALIAGRQRGHEKEITQTTRDLGASLCRAIPTVPLTPLPDDLAERSAYLSECVAILRGSVIRNTNSRDIIDLASIEEPGRLNKALEALAVTHSALWGRRPTTDDLQVARRVAVDSIPQLRRLFLNCFSPSNPKLTRADISRVTTLPASTVTWIGDELVALAVVSETRPANYEVEYQLTESFLLNAQKAALFSF